MTGGEPTRTPSSPASATPGSGPSSGGPSAGGVLLTASLILTVAALASRLLGWVRLLVIGSQFGASSELDAYFAAFRIPDAIFQLVVAGALSAALIPVFQTTGRAARTRRPGASPAASSTSFSSRSWHSARSWPFSPPSSSP